MFNKKIIVFGTGKLAEVALVLFDSCNRTSPVVALTSEDSDCESAYGLRVYSFEGIEKLFPPNEYDIFLAIGESHSNQLRERIFKEAKEKGYRIRSRTSVDAKIANKVKIGEGCWIFEQNNLQPLVEVGNNCILWSGNHIGHHTKIGNNVFISSHVVISGMCTVEDNVFIGVNTTVVDGIKIGKYSYIGAGALILADVPDNIVVYGKWTKTHAKRGVSVLKED